MEGTPEAIASATATVVASIDTSPIVWGASFPATIAGVLIAALLGLLAQWLIRKGSRHQQRKALLKLLRHNVESIGRQVVQVKAESNNSNLFGTTPIDVIVLESTVGISANLLGFNSLNDALEVPRESLGEMAVNLSVYRQYQLANSADDDEVANREASRISTVGQVELCINKVDICLSPIPATTSSVKQPQS